MSAPVTEAHQNLAGAVWSSVEYHKTPHAAQLIADSEALATAELKKRADHWCDMHTVCAKEANQLRAEVERLTAEVANQKVQNNHNWQFQEISEEALKRAEKAEAELKRYKDAVDAQPWASDAPIRVLLDQITSELLTTRNLLMADTEVQAELADEAIALRNMMSERDAAEAELAKAKAIIASIEEDGTEEHNAAVRLRQELAAERARLDWLDSLSPGDAWGIYRSSAQQNANLHAGDPRTLRKLPGIRAAIDAAMKEGSA